MNDMPAARHAPTPRQRPHGSPGGPSLRGGRLALYVGALCATIPAFYLALTTGLQAAAAVLYALSALCLLALQWRRPRQWLDTWLVVGLLACVILPASAHVGWALGVRALSALAVFAQLVRLVQQLLVRTGLAGLVFLASGVLFLCGAGFYWLEPTVRTLSDGLWLAFTTAATVGYGDLIPSTTASRIFSVFVVLLGAGVLSLVTASIAALFVRTQERELERDITRELHHEIRELREEIRQLRIEQGRAPREPR